MNKDPNFRIYIEDWYLLIIFIMMAVAIVIKSYFHPDGYFSFDSTRYLGLAQNLLEGKGYYVSAYGITGQDREFFATWPVGYPAIIFVVAKLTGLSVFWSSKFLNIIFIGIILGIFRYLFKHNAYVYGLILLFSSYIETYSYTWSETIFIVALVWFATSVYLFIVNPKRISLLYFSIMMASLLLFMSRYIGAFSFGLIGLLGLYYGAIKKDKSKSFILIGIAVINIGIMILYLYHNYTETGFPNGVKRGPSPDTGLRLFYFLLRDIVAEALIPIQAMSRNGITVFFVQFSIIGLLLWKYRNNILQTNITTNQKPVTLSLVFVIIGLVYLFFIILIGWVRWIGPGWGYRLLGPGIFLLFIGLIFFVQQRGTKQFFNAFKGFLLFFAIWSYLLNVPYTAWKSSTLNPTYFETITALQEKYAGVEKDSIIVFAPIHINYLYTDMQTRRPNLNHLQIYKEKWSDFMKRIGSENKKNIYMATPEIGWLQQGKYADIDQSVVDFVNKYEKGTLVKLR
jgi:uncharacterized protein YjeT (DUF2065 family)